MMMWILDKLLSKILNKSFRAEALGDLWEANYEMVQRGLPVLFRSYVIVWRSVLLVLASIRIKQIEKNDRAKKKPVETENNCKCRCYNDCFIHPSVLTARFLLILLAAASGSLLFVHLGFVEMYRIQHHLDVGNQRQPSLEL